MADRSGLGFLGFIFGGLTAAVMLVAVTVVMAHVEGSLMLASHALMLVGVPFNRVLRRIRETREHRYDLFRGFFRGVTDETGEERDRLQPRLHSVMITAGSAAVGTAVPPKPRLDLRG